MRSIAVTGAQGFIGKQVINALEESGVYIHAIDIVGPTHSLVRQKIQSHILDLSNGTAVTELFQDIRPEILVHLAWYTAPGAYWNAIENLDWVSTSLELIKAFRNSGGSRVVGVGSCAEYDWRYGYCVENVTPLAPSTLYGQAKKVLFELLNIASGGDRYSFAWGRVFHLYGPGENPGRFIPSIINTILNGCEAVCRNGSLIRDFMDVRDVGAAIAALALSDVEGPVNIAEGTPVSLKNVAELIAAILDSSKLLRVELGNAAPSEPFVVGSSERLRRDVGLLPRHTLESGIHDTIAWWKEFKQC